MRLRKPVKQFKMGEPIRGISSNSMKSNQSGISSMHSVNVSKIHQPRDYENDHKAKIKRAQTLKQEAADRVIEEGSDFSDSGSGFASDTPVAGLRQNRNVENFGEAIVPKKRKKKQDRHEETSYKLNSVSQSNIKGISAAGSVYDSNKKKVPIAQLYPGMVQPKRRYYPTVRAKAIPQQGVPYEDYQRTLGSPSSKYDEALSEA